MKFRFTFLLWMAVVAGCVSQTKSDVGPVVALVDSEPPREVQNRKAMLVGTWYGNQLTTDGGSQEWIAHQSADGTFQVTFRTRSVYKSVNLSTEFGDWGVCANLMVTVTRGYIENGKKVFDGPQSYFWSAYVVTELTHDFCSYRSVQSNNAFQMIRVADDFVFP